MPHIIRLRGPWQYEVLSRLGPYDAPELVHPSGNVQMPCDWSESIGADFCGTVGYRRTFNWTAPLEGHRVTLAFDGVNETAHVTLNGHTLGRFGPGPVWLDITSLLQPHNELLVDVTAVDTTSGAGGLTGEVRLEIEP